MERTTATNTHLAGDAALVERARDGDQEAFTALVDARLSTTYRTASAFLGNEADAREVTEEIFVRAWRDLPELPAPDGFGAWFSRIVDDACRTAALDRRRGKVRELSVTAGPAGTPTSGTLRGQILERVATTKQRSGPRPAAVAAASLERPDRVSTSRRKRLGIGIPVIVLLTVALVAIIGQRMQPPQTPFKSGLVAFVRDGDVYMANADGTGATRIVHQDGLAMSAVVWSPDGRRVAIDGDAGTILYDTSTGTSTHIGGTNPVFSPDGRQIAVIDFDEDAPRLRLQDLVSGAATKHRIDTIGDLAWSPDGRWIAAAGSDGSRGTEGSTNFVRMDVSSGQVLDADPDTTVRGAVRQPAWSPDSFRIAFSRGTITGYRCRGDSMCDSDVFTADPDGTGVVQLNDPKTVADQPAWSPDGDWIAFRQADSAASQDDSTVDPDADVGLVVISPDLTATRTLDAKGVKAFAWSPEGDRLRYVRSEGQGRPATLWEVPFTDDAWADGKAPKARALGLSIDAAIPSYYTRRGAGIAWQSLARAADTPSVPSAKPATPAPAVAIATPQAAPPADPSASWPTLAIDTVDGCAPPTLVATNNGTTTPVGKPCFASDNMQYGWSPTGAQYARLNASGELSIMDLDGTVHVKVGGLTGLGGFSWSPGGSWLDVMGPADRIMRPDGSGLRDLPVRRSGRPTTVDSGSRSPMGPCSSGRATDRASRRSGRFPLARCGRRTGRASPSSGTATRGPPPPTARMPGT